MKQRAVKRVMALQRIGIEKKRSLEMIMRKRAKKTKALRRSQGVRGMKNSSSLASHPISFNLSFIYFTAFFSPEEPERRGMEMFFAWLSAFSPEKIVINLNSL